MKYSNKWAENCTNLTNLWSNPLFVELKGEIVDDRQMILLPVYALSASEKARHIANSALQNYFNVR